MVDDNGVLTHGEISLGDGVVVFTLLHLITKAQNIIAKFVKTLPNIIACPLS